MMKARAIIATLSLRKRRQNSWSGERAATACSPRTIASSPLSSACRRSLAPAPVLIRTPPGCVLQCSVETSSERAHRRAIGA